MAHEEKHPTTVEGFDGSLEDLAKAIGNMRYDSTAELFSHLGLEFARQSAEDKNRNRPELSRELSRVSLNIWQAKYCTDSVWRICKPHMKDGL